MSSWPTPLPWPAERWTSSQIRRIAAALTFVCVLATLWVALPSQGLTDDDDYYAPAGISYFGWTERAVTAPGDAFTQRAIDRAFKPNHEHPPFAKWVMGAAHRLTTALGLFGDLDGARAGTALFAAVLAALMMLWLGEVLGIAYAAIAVVLLFSLPRFWFHSQVATLDVPVACMVVAVAAWVWWAERDPRRSLAAGVVFGLALLTKLNAPFAVLPAIVYVLVLRWRGVKVQKSPHVALRLPPIPRVLFVMAIVGPVLFVLLWPHLWFDTGKRLGAYLGFHLNHYPIYMFYDGVIYEKPFAPWHAPFFMAFSTIPLAVFIAGLVGAGTGIGNLVTLAKRGRADGRIGTLSPLTRISAFLVLQCFFAIAIVAFSNVPKYGGEKLFMPFFPFFCALAALGLRRVVIAFARLVPALKRDRRLVVGAAVALGLLCALPGVIGSAHHHGGYALSFYSESVGGLRGGVARGYERTYYDVADKSLALWLDANTAGKRVHFAPNHKEYVRTYRWLKRDGVIKRTFTLVKKRSDADVVVLTHERRWKTYPRLLDTLSGHAVLHEKRIDGVPLYTVYDVAPQ